MKQSHGIILGLAIGFALFLGFQLGMAVTDQIILVLLIALGCGLVVRLGLQWFFERRNQ